MSPSWHVRATVLPEDVTRDLYVRDGRISFDPSPGAVTLVRSGYVLAGLVDAHCHPGTGAIGAPIDEDLLRQHSEALRDAGVLLVRVLGSASTLPEWFGTREDLPRAQTAGIAVAQRGRFFPGWGRQVPLDDVPRAAQREAEAHGWAKLIVDWMTEDGDYALSIPVETIRAAVERVHAVGGRVAAHTQHADGGLAAVHAGVDSIEHGMHLPTGVLATMAQQGTALVPTAATFAAISPLMSSEQVPTRLRTWFTSGWARHADLVRAAHRAGVRVLAGTDLPPGALRAEVQWLSDDAGMGPAAAIGAASWTARTWLGLPGIEDGAPADLVCFDHDPRSDLRVLDHPSLVVLRGQVVGRDPDASPST